MEHKSYAVSPEIFARYPGYVRGVVIAHGVKNGSSPAELVQMLREAEESVRARVDPEQVAEEPRIKSWREAYRAFGARPAEFRSSVEAMARRVLRGDERIRRRCRSACTTDRLLRRGVEHRLADDAALHVERRGKQRWRDARRVSPCGVLHPIDYEGVFA